MKQKKWQLKEQQQVHDNNKYTTSTVPVGSWVGQHHFHPQTQSSLHNLCPLLQVCLYVPSSQDPKVADSGEVELVKVIKTSVEYTFTIIVFSPQCP